MSNGFSKFITLSEEIVGEKEARLEAAKNKSSFGVTFLDDALMGIRKSDLVLLGASSGAGKSELAIHIALTNVIAGKKVALFALESEKREITQRLLFKRLSTAIRKIRKPVETPNYLKWINGNQEKLFAEVYQNEAKFASDMMGLKIRYRDEYFGIEDLEMDLAVAKQWADLVIIDHLHYLDLDDVNENRAYKNAVKIIRNTSIAYGLPIVLVAHLRKSDRRFSPIVPDQDDFHGTSDILKIATKAITLAPARAVDTGDSTLWATYFRVAKCRLDGSLTRYVGLTIFDAKENAYQPSYKIGQLTPDGKTWNSLFQDQRPDWAIHAND